VSLTRVRQSDRPRISETLLARDFKRPAVGLSNKKSNITVISLPYNIPAPLTACGVSISKGSKLWFEWLTMSVIHGLGILV
jgi:hypothetical protein